MTARVDGCDRAGNGIMRDLPYNLMNIGATAYVARTFTNLTAGGGAVVGLYAEFAAVITSFVARLFTANEAIVRTATRGARLLGGLYLGGTVAATLAKGATTLTFGPTAILLTLGSGALLQFAIKVVNDIFSTASNVRIPTRSV